MHTAAFVSADFAVGALARKKPLPQASHCVSLVGVPADTVHSPREHVLCTPEHATLSDASLLLSLGAANRNLPLLHVLHCVSDVTVPALAVHSPAEQVLCAGHTNVSSSTALPVGADARNRPPLQAWHCVSLVPVPAAWVHSPFLHLECAAHVSVAVLVGDAKALKNPIWQDAHTG